MGTVRRVAPLLALLIPLGACGASTENIEVRPGDSAEVRPPSSASVDACPPASSMLAAVDANTGHPRWRYCDESARFLDVVAATDDIVYALLDYASTATVSSPARLVAFDADDGSMSWTIDVPVLNDGVHMNALRAPGAFAGSGVIVLDILDGDVWHIGYDAATGEERWRIAGAENTVIANTDDLVVGADLYLGEGLGPEIKLVAFDRRTGEERWRIDHGFTDLAGVTKIGHVLLIGQKSVSEIGPPGALMPTSQVAVDIDTGKELWRRNSFIAPSRGTLSRVIVGLDWLPGATSTRLVAIDAETGKKRWETEPLSLSEPRQTSMGEWQPLPQAVVDDASVYLSHDGMLSRLDPESGDVQWEIPAEGNLARSALGHILLVPDAETLTARAVSDGHQEWTVTVPAMQYPPSIVNNTTTFLVALTAAQEMTAIPGSLPSAGSLPTPVRATDP